MIVKILSDTHNDHHKIFNRTLECDMLIHCGDFSTKGNYTEVKSFLDWFVKTPAKYKVLVSGNHDKHLRRANSELIELCKTYGIHLLDNDHIIINGRLIVGGNFVPIIRNGQYKQDLIERKSAWKFLDRYAPMDIDVLITHAPPRTILDTNIEGEHCGCDRLLKWSKYLKPKYHIFGHIHEHGGETYKVGQTTYINSACKDREYKLVRNYQQIKI